MDYKGKECGKEKMVVFGGSHGTVFRDAVGTGNIPCGGCFSIGRMCKQCHGLYL